MRFFDASVVRPTQYRRVSSSAASDVYKMQLWEIEDTANTRMDQLMKQYLGQNPAPDKETNQMAWVQHMNSLKAQAEETIFAELIYS